MFLPWIEAEFGMTDRTARRFMDVASSFSVKVDIVSDLPATALYELAAPSTPQSVREQVEELIVTRSAPKLPGSFHPGGLR